MSREEKAETRERIAITIDIDLRKRVDAAGASEFRTRSNMIERLLEAALAAREAPDETDEPVED